MNKKILITILTILGLTVIVGGFWYAQKHIQDKNQEVVNNEQVVAKKEQGKVEVVKNNNQKENNQEDEKQEEKEIENIKTSPQLSPEEIEKLKKEKDLVWYEIPELNIKFLVTRDTKKDLGYVFKKSKDQFEKDNELILFYNRSEINFKKNRYNHNVCFNNDGDLECPNWMIISKISFKYNEYLKKRFGVDSEWVCHENENNKGKKLLYSSDEYMICYYYDPQAFNWKDDEYKEYLKTIKDKKFGIYLNTIQPIK